MSAPQRLGVWLMVAALFLLHFMLHVGLGYGRGAPDLLTVALLVAAREIGFGQAAALGLVFGLMEDALSILAFGANSIAMTVVAIGGAFTRDLFVGDSWVFRASYFLIGKWMRDLIHWIAVGETIRQPFVEEVVIQGGIGALYAAAVGFVLLEVTGLGREA